MSRPAGPWATLLEEVRRYPSPHNSQPIVVGVRDAVRAQFCYDLDRGLPAESLGIPFGHVCAGVFLESLATVAAGHGWAVTETVRDDDLDFSSTQRRHVLGELELTPVEVTPEATARLAAFRRRRTSRRPYLPGLVDPAVPGEIARVAAGSGHRFGRTDDPLLVGDVMRINQETLFDDLRDDAVHAEILAWLRTSRRRAAETGDGLSAETLLMPGWLLGFAMRHRGLWDLPLAGALLRRVYLSTMGGVRELGWLSGPFSCPVEYVEAGRCFMRVWLASTHHDVYLHPLGTVITNRRSHAAFVGAAGIDESGGDTAWMLFRYGRSDPPPEARRRDLDAMVVQPAGAAG